MKKAFFIEFYKTGFEKNECFFSIVFLALVSLIFFTMSSWAKSQPEITQPSYIVVLTKSLKKKQPAVKFDCREKVFLSFAWLGLQGKHKITALWFNPTGKQQDQIDFEFLADQPKVENWIALKFLDAPDATNPFLPGFFSTKLNGEWQVKFFLDGNFLETLRFDVNC